MPKRSLRLRLTVAFGFGVAVLSILFAAVAYVGVRHIVTTEREATDLRQAYVNAALVRSAVVANSPSLHQLVHSLDTATGSTSLVDVSGAWFASSLTNPAGAVPLALRNDAAFNHVARQIIVVNGRPELIIDVPVPSIHATYFQIHSLVDLDSTLRSLLLVLAAAAALTSLLGAGAGWFITRRAMAPLVVASNAAQRVAAGALETRIPEDQRNTEVSTLATSFNTMVERLVERIEHDARFAGDVSHELRSPLTTLATTVEVMRHSRDQLTAEGQAAFDLLSTDVGTFQQFVEDLLEIAQSDAGAGSMNFEEVRIEELVRQCVRRATYRRQLGEVPVSANPNVANVLVRVDRRRFERVITNLLENANRHAGGATRVRLGIRDGRLAINIDDAGPGIELSERERIFDRFYRGSLANDRGATLGTGLGLAIVRDHVSHFGGSVVIHDSPDGGARFRIELPIQSMDEE